MSSPSSPARRPKRPSLGRSPAGSDAITPRSVIGMAHVVLGAIGVASGGFGLMGSVDLFGARALAVYGALLLLAGATVLAGLWIKDGLWRGAVLAGVVDLARLGFLFLRPGATGLLDVIIGLALLGGAVWMIPELWAERAGPGGRESRA